MKVSQALVVEIITNKQFRYEVEAAFLDMADFTVKLPSTLKNIPQATVANTFKQEYTLHDLIDHDIVVYVFGSRHYENGDIVGEFSRVNYDRCIVNRLNHLGHVTWGTGSIFYSNCHPVCFGNPRNYDVYRGVITNDIVIEYVSIQSCLDESYSWCRVPEAWYGRNTNEFSDNFFRKYI